MTHLFVSREYPPAAYPPGGIGTYLRYITELLAHAGETVHVIGHRWDGAPKVREESIGGRLIVHRVALDDPDLVPRALLASSFPSQAFAWQAALLAERLVESEGVDVIEAQEWEAPLYYFQLRRALNLGPAARPPCVIHLHSPTERIFEANGWDTGVSDYLPAATMEAFSISAADGLLCPSRFLADQALARYGVDPARMNVLPYPLGDVPHLDRSSEAWTRGPIYHIGRLEPRKGVLEWCDAVRQVASSAPAFRMEFIGGDMPVHATGGPMVGRILRDRLPRDLRGRVRFHGSRKRSELFTMLSNGWASVVPSRWDNLPYTCIESMCTGLPVIASPNGGMRELVDDGVSGWIASDGSPEGLAGALRRALATPPADRERMGQAAERAVRHACDNDRIVSQHLDVKRRLCAASTSSTRSAWQTGSPRPVVEPERGTSGGRRGVGVISIGPEQDGAAAAAEMVRRQPELLAVALVDARLRLEPAALATCLDVLETNDDVGAVSAWTRETGLRDRVCIPPWPALPFVMVRAEACAGFDENLRTGWCEVIYPSVLGSMVIDRDDPASIAAPSRYSSMARAVQRMHMPFVQWLLSSPADERRAVLRGGLSDPTRTVRWLVGRGKRALGIGRASDSND